MATAHSRPGPSTHNEAARMTQSQLVTELRALLGAKLVAYLGRAKETWAVRQWADGAHTFNDEADVERLRIAYRAARLIVQRDTPEVAQTWFQGRPNPRRSASGAAPP